VILTILFWLMLGASAASFVLGKEVHFAAEIIAAGLFAIARVIHNGQSEKV